STPATAALLQETRTIPVIFGIVADPIGSGFVASFPRPGGNATGFAVAEPTQAGKWMELLKEIAPQVTRVATLFNPAMASFLEFWLKPFKAAAPSFGVEVIEAPVHDTSELESVMAAQAREANSGLFVILDAFTITYRSELHRWRLAIDSLPFMDSVFSLNLVGCCPTERTGPIIFGARRPMRIASGRAKSRATFPFRPPSNSNLSSI